MIPLERIREVASRFDGIVVVDEAYIDFAGPSALELIGRYENLLVVQTFSKSRSMAGMRIGFAIGNQRLIRALNDVKYSYNSYTMNLTSIVMGAESVRDEAYFKETTDKIIATRERAKTRLRELGFTFPDSRANFIFASHPCVPACKLFEALKEERIYVRYFGGERLCDSLRISIGSDEEMDVLFAFLERYLKDFS